MHFSSNKSTKWLSLTDLGRQFSLSAVTIGKKLKELELRLPDGKPTENAKVDRYCRISIEGFGRFQTEICTWNREKVAELLLASKLLANTPTEKRYAKFVRLYPSWHDALPTACEMMFNLNRYAKHESCTVKHQELIYDLKNQVIQLLYQQGFSTDCWRHHIYQEERECFRCDGTGVDYDMELGPEDCDRCNGTGIYRKSKTLSFVCFTFVLGDKRYNWHQPKNLVKFSFTVTANNKVWDRDLDELEKPITLPASKFAEAKDLLRWILDQEKQERQAAKVVAAQVAVAS